MIDQICNFFITIDWTSLLNFVLLDGGKDGKGGIFIPTEWITFFDFVIFFVVAWGAYKGYVQGAIVQSISLFALLVGLTISVVLTKFVYRFLSARSDVPDLFAIVLLGIIFVFAIIGSAYINKLVKENVAEAPKSQTNRGIGAGIGVIKFYLIASVYILVLFKIEDHAHFIPDRERKSTVAFASRWVVTKIFPYLKMEKKEYRPFDKPEEDFTED